MLPHMIEEIQSSVTIPVMAKCRIGHFAEAQVLESLKVDFIDDSGDKWQEFIVYHHNLKKWMDITGETDIKKSPYSGSTAPEINWDKRVAMQAAVQKYVTHSISSTINLPNDVSLEKVSEIYLDS